MDTKVNNVIATFKMVPVRGINIQKVLMTQSNTSKKENMYNRKRTWAVIYSVWKVLVKKGITQDMVPLGFKARLWSQTAWIQISSLLPSILVTLSSILILTQRDGMGREEGEGFRMGNTCIPVVDSFWYMANQYNIVKLKNQIKKYLKNKKNKMCIMI